MMAEKEAAAAREDAHRKRLVVKALRKAFRRADADGSGTLDVAEVTLDSLYIQFLLDASQYAIAQVT